ncbi:glutamate-tRNA ligase [Elsinoe australis]|uniref:Glutamate--tRNA ligase, mitochondrial n=1 Tax=Elsinoe australis TaxID=40998 RepID=A0A2P7Z3S3_9PEZI|nr:glutamate-tRNA ligase [Elsinoe australis]
MTSVGRSMSNKNASRMLAGFFECYSKVWRPRGSYINVKHFSASSIHRKKIRKILDKSQPLEPARTRFAPSPTGFLHLGSLRTAIFNYLWAKKTGGQFILRIEDTDRKRTVAGAEKRLCDDLRWAGLHWDEGPDVGGRYRPYNQSSRNDLYQYHANELLQTGHAYRCFCPSKQDAQQSSEPTEIGARIGGCSSDCKSLPKGEVQDRVQQGQPSVVRFNSKQERVIWKDFVYGEIHVKGDSGSKMFNSIADTVLMKTDGTPTYHLANVVDDHDMRITHVIRGTEWMPSTALHVALYEAFRWQPPLFSHVSLLTDEGHNKLSKRNFDVDVASLIQKHGLLPEALVNYLVLLGWSNPDKNDVKSIQELTDIFDLKFTKGDTVVTTEKLFYLQKQHARRRIIAAGSDPSQSHLLDLLVQYLQKPAKVSKWDREVKREILGNRDVDLYLRSILLIDPGTYDTPRRYLDENNYFFRRAKAKTTRQCASPATESEFISPDEATQADSLEDGGSFTTTSASLSNQTLDLTYPAEVRQMVEQIVENDKVKKALSLWHNERKSLPRNAHELHEIIAGAAVTCQNVLFDLMVAHATRVLKEKGADTEGESFVLKKTPEYKAMNVDFHKYLRSLISGRSEAGPSTFRVMAVLGYEESVRRVREQSSVT